MNLSALKSFAPAVRRQLLEAVGRKLDVVLTGDTADLRAARVQVEKLRHQAKADRKGLVERVAYTWFNRLSALRLLDARGWHPFRARVLTPATAEETQPEVLKLTRAGALPAELASLTDLARLNQLLDGHLPSSDPQGEVYRHLVLAACRFYHRLMPFLFEALDDETELLLPDDLLTAHSVVHGFRTAISDEDCAEVEVLGWLYQFYISEKKDEVMARKSAVPSEDIPAVTQLFTPHWIVRYLVENSLGRLWLLNRPGSRLREHMPYYIEGEPETDFLKITQPEDIRLLDPACGSGHMLTYAFDLLVKIYEEEGHAPSEIPGLILRHNLYGLEICPRAAQLAQFALVCKAREYARAAFRNPVQPQVMCLQDVVFDDDELQNFSSAVHCPLSTAHLKQLHQFRENTSTFGSLIQPILSVDEIATLKAKIGNIAPPSDLIIQDTHRKICRALDQAEMLSQRYHIVVANPPYMGTNYMVESLNSFVRNRFSFSRGDLFASFMYRNRELAIKNGRSAMITMQSWMFLSSYEELRNKVLANDFVETLLHLGPSAFDTIAGEVVQTCAFVLNLGIKNHNSSTFFQLTSASGEVSKERLFFKAKERSSNELRTVLNQNEFLDIPGSPFAYWTSPIIRHHFKTTPRLSEIAEPTHGIATDDNDRFLRYWYECKFSRLAFGAKSRDDAKKTGARWFPVTKGGPFRRWYGNLAFVIDWENDGYLLRTEKHSTGRIRATNFNLEKIFRPNAAWSTLSTNNFALRYTPIGTLFESKGSACFTKDYDTLLGIIGFGNSNLVNKFLLALAPMLDYHEGPVSRLPYINKVGIRHLSIIQDAINLARIDWDNFETSWDFRDLPLLRSELKGTTLEESWNNWAAYCQANIARMQELETENNRLWIHAYGLQDELTPEVPENEITLARPDQRKDIAAFLSYAVGCMMGRYSLDAPCIILADASDTLANYLAKLGKPIEQLRFVPDADGILPILDGDWFEDDIVARTRQFLRATFGDATLEANLRFIEKSLGKDLRKYFLTDFYKDHLQTYKKRPIYWLFQSPKKGFSALIYLHRYNRDTANRVLNRYLREYLHKLQARLDQLDHIQTSAGASARDKTQARKESDQLRKIRRDCEDYERDILLPLAQQRLELDLDDGVKVNYLKLGNALAPIPGLAASSEE